MPLRSRPTKVLSKRSRRSASRRSGTIRRNGRQRYSSRRMRSYRSADTPSTELSKMDDAIVTTEVPVLAYCRLTHSKPFVLSTYLALHGAEFGIEITVNADDMISGVVPSDFWPKSVNINGVTVPVTCYKKEKPLRDFHFYGRFEMKPMLDLIDKNKLPKLGTWCKWDPTGFSWLKWMLEINFGPKDPEPLAAA